MLGVAQLIQLHSITLSIVTDIVRKCWVGILIVGDVDMDSALDTRGDGGEILVASERLAMRALCYLP